MIPVLAQYRKQFGGVVHDQSATGQTLYIEPGNVVELNNRLRQAQIEEKQEIQRVLTELSDLIRPYQHELGQNAQVLGHLDLVNAKLNMRMPCMQLGQASMMTYKLIYAKPAIR
nr:hypothetical protein [Limosilactobacillus equigenerosi]